MSKTHIAVAHVPAAYRRRAEVLLRLAARDLRLARGMRIHYFDDLGAVDDPADLVAFGRGGARFLGPSDGRVDGHYRKPFRAVWVRRGLNRRRLAEAVSHEAYHRRQYELRVPFSEREADRYAREFIERWTSFEGGVDKVIRTFATKQLAMREITGGWFDRGETLYRHIPPDEAPADVRVFVKAISRAVSRRLGAAEPPVDLVVELDRFDLDDWRAGYPVRAFKSVEGLIADGDLDRGRVLVSADGDVEDRELAYGVAYGAVKVHLDSEGCHPALLEAYSRRWAEDFVSTLTREELGAAVRRPLAPAAYYVDAFD